MNILKGRKLILASASPRRRELLSGAGFDFTVDTGNNFEEVIPEGIDPEEIPALMSAGKSHGFHRELSDNEILLTSDTIVVCNGRPMGKPHSAEEAAEMLRFLSGKEHSVVTAITIRSNAGEKTVSDRATVHFKELTDNEITYYINEYRPFDKAGAYAIQEWIGYIGITGIEGSFYTIMGLPIHLVYRELESL
ncbi:MAG: Maf family nucleotide pyrophosphatase [Bacteroidales bacterium]|nr:Maf family nucleotide pyrophosphatase [Bacteroidales bacterium]MDY5782036.1 Maf family nucleotide pyrophosphatase [Candidatus Cryptobacteroides sp.]